MSKLIKSVERPACSSAIEEAKGLWLCSDDAEATEARVVDVAASILPHPEGHGRMMLRQVPAGTVLIEVDAVTAKIVATVTAEAIEEKPIEDVEDLHG